MVPLLGRLVVRHYAPVVEDLVSMQHGTAPVASQRGPLRVGWVRHFPNATYKIK